jgi:hypothetical protein
MLPIILATFAAQAAPEDLRPTIRDYLAEVCPTVPDDVCDRLTGFVEAFERLATRGAVDAGTWCCKSCGSGGNGGPRVTCTGCADPGIWKCGGIINRGRPVRLDCPGMTTSAEDGTVNCY